jgi:hypothetical protein
MLLGPRGIKALPEVPTRFLSRFRVGAPIFTSFILRFTLREISLLCLLRNAMSGTVSPSIWPRGVIRQESSGILRLRIVLKGGTS